MGDLVTCPRYFSATLKKKKEIVSFKYCKHCTILPSEKIKNKIKNPLTYHSLYHQNNKKEIL